MTFFPLSDDLYSDPRFAGLSGDALALWTRANSWAVNRLTDGFIPSTMLATFNGATADHAAELVESEVWKRVRGGFQVLDWPPWTGRARRRGPIPAAVRELVYRRDGYRCVTCGSPEELTLDHVEPWSRGGPDHPSNLQTMCRPCNSRKGARV